MKKLLLIFSLFTVISCSAQNIGGLSDAATPHNSDKAALWQPWNGVGPAYTFGWTLDSATAYFQRRLSIGAFSRIRYFSSTTGKDTTDANFIRNKYSYRLSQFGINSIASDFIADTNGTYIDAGKQGGAYLSQFGVYNDTIFADFHGPTNTHAGVGISETGFRIRNFNNTWKLPTTAGSVGDGMILSTGGQLIWSAGGGADATAWHKGGDAGTDPATDFIGTTDNTVLNFKLNSSENSRMRITPDSNIVIDASNNNTGLYIVGGLSSNSIQVSLNSTGISLIQNDADFTGSYTSANNGNAIASVDNNNHFASSISVYNGNGVDLSSSLSCKNFIDNRFDHSLSVDSFGVVYKNNISNINYRMPTDSGSVGQILGIITNDGVGNTNIGYYNSPFIYTDSLHQKTYNLDSLITVVDGATDTLYNGYTGILFTGGATATTYTLVLPPDPYEGQRILIENNDVTFVSFTLDGNGNSLSTNAQTFVTTALATAGLQYTLRFKAGTWY